MSRAARRRRLVLALALANALVMLRPTREAPPPPSSTHVRAQRQAAIRAALAGGRTTYSFETRWTPPVTR